MELLRRCQTCNGGDDPPAVTVPAKVRFQIKEVCIECSGAGYLLTEEGHEVKNFIDFLRLQGMI
jgi:DnaJ-class molecular chaperone